MKEDILEELKEVTGKMKNVSIVARVPTREEINMQEALRLCSSQFEGIEPLQVSGIMPKHKDQVK